MKFPSFSYVAPDTIDGAIEHLAADESARPLAGGQSLLPMMALRLASPTLLVDLGRIKSLNQIELHERTVRIGAMVTHARNKGATEIRSHAPLIAQALEHVAHDAVQRRGTIGGSIANADSAAEMPVVATALDANVVATGKDGARAIPASQFFLGHFTTALEPAEVVTRIDVPFSRKTWAFEEVSRRKGDFALAMAAVGVEMSDGRCHSVRIVLGGISDRPHIAVNAQEYLVGMAIDDSSARQAAGLATSGLKPRSDIHASSAYRLSVAGVLVRRCLLRAAQGEI